MFVMCAVLYVCVNCFVMIEGMSVVSNECDEPSSYLGRPIGAHGCEVMYFRSFCLKCELGFLNCDGIYIICVVNKQFVLLDFVFNFVYVDLKYN